MYSKKELDQVMNGKQKESLIDRLEELKSQMNEIQQDYFGTLKPKMATPTLNASAINQVMSLDLNWSERGILLHFLAMEAQGVTDVYISGAADSINMNRPAYAKAVRKLAAKGYLKPTVKRAVYKLNKVF